MKFNIKYLLIIPVLIVAFGIIRFARDKLAPFRLSGTVEATQIIVSSRMKSIIEKIIVEEGAVVQKDAELAKLDCQETELALELSKSSFERNEKLFKTGTASLENFEKSKTAYLNEKIRKSWCSIKSPVEGIVTHKFKESGEIVTPGTRLFAVLDPNDYWAFFYIPHNILHRFKLGQKIKTFLPESGDEFSGEIIKINENAEFTPKNVQTFDERSRLVYGVKVKLTNRDSLLKPGMSLDIEVEKP